MHPPTDGTGVVGLINSLKHHQPGVRRHAVRTLGDQKLEAPLAIRQFSKILTDADPQVRVLAVKALGKIGPAAVPTLIEALGSQDERVRREVVWALGRIGPGAGAAVDALIAALRDGDVRVCQGAARALGLIGPAAAGAVPVLLALLSESSFVLCRLAAWALGQIGAAAVPALVDGMDAPDIFARCDAAWGLGQMGPAAREAVPAIMTILRSSWADCLWKCTSPQKQEPGLEETMPVFIPPRQGTVEAFCLLTIKALGAIGPGASEAVPYLTQLLSAGHGTAQLVAARALRQIDTGAAHAAGVSC